MTIETYQAHIKASSPVPQHRKNPIFAMPEDEKLLELIDMDLYFAEEAIKEKGDPDLALLSLEAAVEKLARLRHLITTPEHHTIIETEVSS